MPPGNEGTFTIQVGAFSALVNAGKLRDFFEGLNYTVEITSKVRDGKSLYLVWVGSFQSSAEAKKIARTIKTKHNFNPLVVERY